jgi:hypothetical protein
MPAASATSECPTPRLIGIPRSCVGAVRSPLAHRFALCGGLLIIRRLRRVTLRTVTHRLAQYLEQLRILGDHAVHLRVEQRHGLLDAFCRVDRRLEPPRKLIVGLDLLQQVLFVLQPFDGPLLPASCIIGDRRHVLAPAHPAEPGFRQPRLDGLYLVAQAAFERGDRVSIAVQGVVGRRQVARKPGRQIGQLLEILQLGLVLLDLQHVLLDQRGRGLRAIQSHLHELDVVHQLRRLGRTREPAASMYRRGRHDTEHENPRFQLVKL